MRRLPLKEIPRYECLIEASKSHPELDPSACEVFLNLVHVGDLISEREGAYLEKYGLSQARFVVLMLLSGCEEGQMKSSVIADMSAVSKATMTGLLDTLVRDGLIERSGSDEDRRVIFVSLSRKGKDLLRRVTPGYFRTVSGMTGILQEADRKRSVSLLRKIKDHLSDEKKSSTKKKKARV